MSYEYIIYLYIAHMFVYWGFSAIFYIVDLFALDKYHNNWKKYKKAAIDSFCNQLFIGLPTLYLLNDNINNAIIKSENDTFFTTLIKIFFIANLSNIFFYILHYLLHFKFLYNLIHYKHHEFIETIAVAAVYAHPIEYLFANVLAFVVPFIMIGTNFPTAFCLISIGTFVTLMAHCNYNLFGIKNAHLIHHKLFLCNYGFGEYLDKMFGTYREQNR
jgi:sterol desaturase/sphingolipid hydroxylase (fatty acid hydroxylase superfamily)